MRGEDLEQLTNHKLGNWEHHPCPFQWRYQVPGRMSQRQCPFILDSNVTKGNIFFSIVVNWLSERDQIWSPWLKLMEFCAMLLPTAIHKAKIKKIANF